MIEFGTGGWRAIIGENFTKKNLQKVCQALSTLLDETGIVIGYDRRFLSDFSARWAAEVFAGNGKKVWFINHVSPTPLVMFTVAEQGISYGIMITASHNPAHYNGVKVITKGGRDADLDTTQRIESIISQNQTIHTIPFEEGVAQGLITNIHPMNQYIDAILSKTDAESIREANLQIVIDPMFGVARTALLSVLITARCNVEVINDRHDALFGGRLPAPEPSTLHKLRDVVRENQYDLGIATDGDADRIGVIDSTGSFLHPNMLLAVLYYYFLAYKKQKGDVVRNVATTHLLDKIAVDFGQTCHEVPVGFKYISSSMEKNQALIGGESSGGLTLHGHILGKDGIFAATVLVEILAVSGKKLNDFVTEIEERYGHMHWVETSYSFSAEKREELIEILFEQKSLPPFKTPIERISYLDGVKVYFTNGDWVIARFSGTEPLIRVFSESQTGQLAQDYAEAFQQFLGLENTE